MVTGKGISVAGDVLRWAREQRGLSVDVAAKRLGISPDRLSEIEAGIRQPTMPQLRNMSEKYKRPLIVLLLSEPPTTFTALRDFRRLPDAERGTFSPELRDEMRRAAQQQEIYLELKTQMQDLPPLAQLPRSPDIDGLAAQTGRADEANLPQGSAHPGSGRR